MCVVQDNEFKGIGDLAHYEGWSFSSAVSHECARSSSVYTHMWIHAATVNSVGYAPGSRRGGRSLVVK